MIDRLPPPDGRASQRRARGGEKRGVLLLVVLSMLTLFMMLGAAYLVVATRSRETARAYAKLSLRSDNVRLPHSQIFDTVMLRVLRGVPAGQTPNVTLAQPAQNSIGTTVKPTATSYSALGQTYQFESLLSDKYGFETLSGTAAPGGSYGAVYEAAPLLVLPNVTLDAAQVANVPGGFHEFELVGRVLTLLGPGRDPSSHRILRAVATGGGAYMITIDNQPRNRVFEAVPNGASCRIVINGREFTGDGTSAPHEAWDGFDQTNSFLAAVLPRDLQNETDSTKVSVSSSVVRKVGFVQNGADPATLGLLTGGINGFDHGADNDNDGVKDGFYLDFGLPTVIAPNGDQITLHASVLVVDLDGRVNVNAHGSLSPVVYPHSAKSGTHARWIVQTGLPASLSGTNTFSLPTGSGYGPPEVNLDLLFPPASSPAATYSFERLRGITPSGLPAENPALFLRVGLSLDRMTDASNGGRTPTTGRFYSNSGGQLSTTPQIDYTQGRYGNFIATNYASDSPSTWSWTLTSPNSNLYWPPGIVAKVGNNYSPINDIASAVNDHRSPADPATLASALPRTLDYSGVPPAWWNADSGSTFNWADNSNLSATTAGVTWKPPVPRAIYNSPPDLHGRMKTMTAAAATNAMVPQVCFIKPEWSRNGGSLDVESRDDPYEIRLDTRAPRNSWLKNYGASNPGANVFNLSELENILRPYDIDSQKLPPRLEAILGSVSEEARLRITTDSWDTTVITGTAAANVSNWVKTKIQAAVRNDPAKLYGATAQATTAELKGLLNRELARMERFDLNRPLTGTKPATYDIKDRYYAQRQAYFKDLYVLLCALTSGGQGGFDAARCAQWAANVVEFRDADSTMTPFEYDTNPENGWDVDGDAKTVDSGGERKLVFGTERPEMVIAQTSAWEDDTTGELFIVLHRPWNAKAFARLTAGQASSDKSIAAEACDPQFDVYDNNKNPLDQVDLGRKSGAAPSPPNNNTSVSDTTKYPIWRLRIDDGAGNVSYVRCDVTSGGGNVLVSPTVTNTTTPRLGADGWICLQGTNSLAGQQVTFAGGSTVKQTTFQNFRVPGTPPAAGAANRTATVYLERLTDPTASPNASDWNLAPSTKPEDLSAAQLARMAVYRVVDQAKIEVVNRVPLPDGSVPPAKNAMKLQRRTDDAVTTFWRGNPASDFPTVAGVPQLGPYTATQKPAWFNWPNRPFIGSPELFLVHSLDAENLLKNYTKTTLDPDATPDHWTAAFLKTLKNPPLFDAVGVPTRFAGIHNTTTDPKGNLASFAGLDQVTTPVNQLSSFREPGRVNLNTVGADDVWNAVVAGPLVKNDGSPDAVKKRSDADFATSPAQTTAGLLALKGGAPSATVLRPIAETNAIFAGGSPKAVDLNPAHDIYTATRLSNTATTRSHLFGVWITLREATAPPGSTVPADPDGVRFHRAFYVIDRSIPVAHEPGRDHNVWDAVLLRRIIE